VVVKGANRVVDRVVNKEADKAARKEADRAARKARVGEAGNKGRGVEEVGRVGVGVEVNKE
jgi:hypothetical protein